MSRPGRPPRTQQRLLTQEDEALWMSVARGLKPFRKKPRVHAADEPKPSAEPGLPATSPPKRIAKPGTAGAVIAKASDASGLPAHRPLERNLPPPAALDRRQVRRLSSGRVEIEARLDLHGMRAGEAHAALRKFVLGCYARGQRYLLVITGKGGAADARDLPFEMPDRAGRGVLKRSVPLWLAQPELRAVIVSVTQAHPRHGGEGALYIQLRSRLRAGSPG
ncbi:MAG: Smr/MutS family protein [Hyphomicrobiaceae bacterium]|nr:Smr/MutS family protein [Hyphomicrobiaceae bacterium]